MNWIRYVLPFLASIVVGSCFSEPVPQESTPKEFSTPKPKEKSLPEKCKHLLKEPKPDSWNPTTQLYTTPGEGPGDSEWAKCMGVGAASFRRHMFRSDI